MKESQTQANDDIDMNLVGDMMLLYLSVGSTLGECELYNRIGDAIASKNMGEMVRIQEFVDALPGDIKQRIIQGEDHVNYDLDIDLDGISEDELAEIDALAESIRNIA